MIPPSLAAGGAVLHVIDDGDEPVFELELFQFVLALDFLRSGAVQRQAADRQPIERATRLAETVSVQTVVFLLDRDLVELILAALEEHAFGIHVAKEKSVSQNRKKVKSFTKWIFHDSCRKNPGKKTTINERNTKLDYCYCN